MTTVQMFRFGPYHRWHACRWHRSLQCHHNCDASWTCVHLGALAPIQLQRGPVISLCRCVRSEQRGCIKLGTALHWKALPRFSLWPVLRYMLSCRRCYVSPIPCSQGQRIPVALTEQHVCFFAYLIHLLTYCGEHSFVSRLAAICYSHWVR